MFQRSCAKFRDIYWVRRCSEISRILYNTWLSSGRCWYFSLLVEISHANTVDSPSSVCVSSGNLATPTLVYKQPFGMGRFVFPHGPFGARGRPPCLRRFAPHSRAAFFLQQISARYNTCHFNGHNKTPRASLHYLQRKIGTSSGIEPAYHTFSIIKGRQ